jgi:hypothetical protein
VRTVDGRQSEIKIKLAALVNEATWSRTSRCAPATCVIPETRF